VLMLSCSHVSGQATKKIKQSSEDKLEALILKAVRSVPEVQSFFKETPAAYKPMLMFERQADSTLKYYSVQLGISNFDMFRTTERFCVDPKTFQVYFWDVFADDNGFSNSAIISLAKWRYWRTKPEWKKPHTWKAGKLVALSKQ